MAELADAYGSGPYEGNFMQVQVLLPAPRTVDKIDVSPKNPETMMVTGFYIYKTIANMLAT